MSQAQSFYGNEVFVEEIDFTTLPDHKPMPPLERKQVPFGTIMVQAAAVALTGLLAFTVADFPPSATSTPELRALSDLEPPGGLTVVPVPAAHVAAATRARRLFVSVPLTAAEELPDPDFDL